MMKRVYIILFLTIFIALGARNVFAFESTSTTYQLHASDVENGTGASTSTSYICQEALGQTAPGLSTSTSYKDYSGILYWLFPSGTPAIGQIHYRWRNDDGSETTATYATTQDTILSSGVYAGDRIRLRISLSNSGTGSATNYNYRLEYASQANSCSTWTAVPATATTEAWQMGGQSNVADNIATTNSAGVTDPGGQTFKAGILRTLNGQTGTMTIPKAQFSEIEYAIKSTTNVTTGQTYCFRVTNNGSTTNFTYTVNPQISVSAVTYRPQGGGSAGSVESPSAPPSGSGTGGGTRGGVGTFQCNDTIDNNSNGLIDAADPNCHAGGNINNPYVPTWDSESTPPGGNSGGGTPGSGGGGGDVGFLNNKNSFMAQVIKSGASLALLVKKFLLAAFSL
jgi:hypothetical protein